MIKICPICKEHFETKKSRKIYCSEKCKKISHKINSVDNYKNSKKIVICKNCKNEFNSQTGAVYCSNKCRLEARIKRKNIKLEMKNNKQIFDVYCANCNIEKGISILNKIFGKDSTNLYWKLRKEYIESKI